MSDQTNWDCQERLFTEFLIANPCLDGDADLQWHLHATYWHASPNGHRNAINTVMQEARNHGITGQLYTDPATKHKILEAAR